MILSACYLQFLTVVDFLRHPWTFSVTSHRGFLSFPVLGAVQQSRVARSRAWGVLRMNRVQRHADFCARRCVLVPIDAPVAAHAAEPRILSSM